MMAKLTVTKVVEWDDCGRTRTGKIKQMYDNHVVVATKDGEYIVATANVRVIPTIRKALSEKKPGE